MESLLRTIQGFGVGRLVATLGGAAGVAAILIAILMKVGTEPKSLLYANLDLKEASQITAALDQAGVKYEAKGDGSTLMVDRDKVASTRLLLSGKGLPTSGSVGYEIFDSAPSLGQTDFVQNLNRQRALEGELARTIRAIQGVNFVRVHLVLPKKQLFEDDAATASASILVATNAGRLSSEQVRAIRNLVAGAVPDLKPDRVSIADQQGELLAGEGEDAIGDGGAARNQVEERIRRTVKDIVEGVVGPGHARVQVTADLDMTSHTTQSEKYDPDGQVVRSTQTSDEKANENKSSTSGLASASQNIPGAQPGNGAGGDSSNTGKQDETTNYEISKTTTTEVQQPGQVKRLSVAVAVDGATGPAVHGKPGPYTPRSAEEMKQIDQLVRSAIGFDDKRGDQVSVVNVRFDQSVAEEGVASASAFNFDKNDLMRLAELAVLMVVAALLIFFVAKPMLASGGGSQMAQLLGGPNLAGAAGGTLAIAGQGAGHGAGQGANLALPAPGDGVDIARIEGQVRTSSVKKVAEFVEKHPEESVSILRSWLHEG